jgi:hypothetical protein
MTSVDWVSIIVGGLGILGDYREPLNPLGPTSIFERDYAKRTARYNRNPRVASTLGGLALVAVAILMQFFKL